MNKLKMKAKAGVTLVELLVVILIVTILSVSLLPLLKPYIEKAKYAAEPIPVLANLQTKIELYQYEKNLLPGVSLVADQDSSIPYYYTWFKDENSDPPVYLPLEPQNNNKAATSGHFQHLTDTDWQDLTGKNMRPSDFQYAVTENRKNGTYCYAVGVFGGHDDSGLAAGTGYAVCKVVDLATSNKVVAIWERYKPESSVTNLFFKAVRNETAPVDGGIGIPQVGSFGDDAAGWQAVTSILHTAGWQF